ncbi:MAG: hypothetical protein U0T73_01635 [Chitinophagales bacterium]
MKATTGFYKLKSAQRTEQSIQAIITLQPHHAVFEGHFPERPVVPGVCQMQMAGEIFSSVIGERLQVQRVQSVKFPSPMEPVADREIAVQINFEKKEDGAFAINAIFSQHEPAMIFSRMKAVYQVKA